MLARTEAPDGSESGAAGWHWRDPAVIRSAAAWQRRSPESHGQVSSSRMNSISCNLRMAMRRVLLQAMLLMSLSAVASSAWGQVAGILGDNDLTVAMGGQAKAVVVVAKQASQWERKAAEDLAKYIHLMSGAKPVVLNALPVPDGPALIVGQMALHLKPALHSALAKAAKQKPLLRADAIVVERDGDRVYLAGTGPDAHYYAVSYLLQLWGVRWYLPTDFGECVPSHSTLKVGTLNFSYGPPFEVRRYWLSWLGDTSGQFEFSHRNFFNQELVPSGHCLQQYTKDVEPKGKGHFNIPITDPRTAQSVASKIADKFKAGERIMLGIEDGMYESDYPNDKKLLALQYDKYFMSPSYTDCFMTFYNNVADTLLTQYPHSNAKIGFLAYSNLTLPPVKVAHGSKPLVAYLAPIDIDPNHGMDDGRSGPRREYKDMMYKWAKVMDGRVVIYDYDQGMLVWRDLPNPSHHVFARDVKIYRNAGILGIQTESRGALATTFLNLFFRGQLMWNPDVDTRALLKEFYPGFYGPAAVPMARYWSRIFDAWERTDVTEHEYHVIPAIYTSDLVEDLRADLKAAEAALRSSNQESRRMAMFAKRLRFTRASFTMIDTYVTTVQAAARDADYSRAVEVGTKALEAHQSLRSLNPLYVTGIVGGEDRTAWLAGEVRQYTELRALMDGSKGSLIQRLPSTWSFKMEKPLPTGWRYSGPEGPKPKGDDILAREQPNEINGWRAVRTDLYLQGQGVVAPNGDRHLGHYWYANTFVILSAADAKRKVRLMIPGLFNEAWLYINGEPVAHRNYKEPWWHADYRFEWDVDISQHIRPGSNEIRLRGFNPHHFGGIFRRPFLYRPRTSD